MPDQKRKRVCPDPDCKKETESDEKGIFELCAHCGFDIGAFDMRRRLTKAEKAADAAEEEERKKNAPPTKKKSVLANL